MFLDLDDKTNFYLDLNCIYPRNDGTMNKQTNHNFLIVHCFIKKCKGDYFPPLAITTENRKEK